MGKVSFGSFSCFYSSKNEIEDTITGLFLSNNEFLLWEGKILF